MCLGKIIAIFEIKKLTATLLLKYHVSWGATVHRN